MPAPPPSPHSAAGDCDPLARPTGPRAPGSPPTQATRGSEAPAPRQVIDPRGNSERCLQGHREGKGSYSRRSGGARGSRRPASPARPGRLPPAAAPSAGSLRPSPPPPSSAAAATGKGAEATASLPLPTTQAQRRPTVRTRATSVRRAARAPSVTGATRRRGGATAAREGLQVRPAPSPANLGL